MFFVLFIFFFAIRASSGLYTLCAVQHRKTETSLSCKTKFWQHSPFWQVTLKTHLPGVIFTHTERCLPSQKILHNDSQTNYVPKSQVMFDATTLHRGLLLITKVTTFGCYQQLIFSTSTLRPLLLELVFIADIVLGH